MIVACAAAYFWIELLAKIPSTSRMLEQSRAALPRPEDTAGWTGLILLAVVVAPLCEEFIFRGLVYQGLRRTCGFAASLLWSSLFFASVHPAASAGAVMAMAAVNSFVMERTGRLTACMAVHAFYNGFVLWFQAAG